MTLLRAIMRSTESGQIYDKTPYVLFRTVKNMPVCAILLVTKREELSIPVRYHGPGDQEWTTSSRIVKNDRGTRIITESTTFSAFGELRDAPVPSH